MTSPAADIKSSRPVLGMIIVLRLPCASSVIRMKRPRSFSLNSMKKCLRSTCSSLVTITLSMTLGGIPIHLLYLYRHNKGRILFVRILFSPSKQLIVLVASLVVGREELAILLSSQQPSYLRFLGS